MKCLKKIGTRRGLLKQSIRREVGVLFLAPGILGVVHVLFGLQMFGLFMQNPYKRYLGSVYDLLRIVFHLLCTDDMVIYRNRIEKEIVKKLSCIK